MRHGIRMDRCCRRTGRLMLQRAESERLQSVGAALGIEIVEFLLNSPNHLFSVALESRIVKSGF